MPINRSDLDLKLGDGVIIVVDGSPVHGFVVANDDRFTTAYPIGVRLDSQPCNQSARHWLTRDGVSCIEGYQKYEHARVTMVNGQLVVEDSRAWGQPDPYYDRWDEALPMDDAPGASLGGYALRGALVLLVAGALLALWLAR